MKRTARIVFVLFVVTLIGSLPLLAEVTVVPFADRQSPEPAPVDLPPWLPAPEPENSVLNVYTSTEVGNVDVVNVRAVGASMNLGSSAAQAIPGARAGSFMSEQRLAERSLRGTIKRLG